MTKEHFKLFSAVHLLLLRDGKVLLARRFQTGYEDGNYSVPAGHIDGNESATAAMVREAREEVGITLAEKDLHMVHVMHRKSEREAIDFFFTAMKWSGEPRNGEPEKCDDVRWFPLEALPNNVIPYIRSAIAEYNVGRVFSEFGWQERE